MFYKEYKLAQSHHRERLAEAGKERLLRATRSGSKEKPINQGRFLPRGKKSLPRAFSIFFDVCLRPCSA